MPYGRRTNPSVYRRSTYANRQKAARASKVATKRKTYYKKAPKLKRIVRQVRNLRNAALGPVQIQRQYWTSGHHPVHNSPFLHQVNDPIHNSSNWFHWNNITGVDTQIGHWLREDGNPYENSIHLFQDRVYLKYIEYEFQFSGYVVDTRLRIDVIRQKKLPRDLWSNYNQNEFLPHALGNFKDLAGFTQQYIHPRYFEHVVKTKYIYMNSQSSSSTKYNLYHTSDLDADEGTPFENTATGPPTKYCKMYIPFNKFLRARDDTAVPTEDVDDDTPAYQYFRWNRAHPFEPVWMIISSDSGTVDGDGVTVKVHRKVVWRDPHN